MRRVPMPIDPSLPALQDALSRVGVVVLQAPTGAGKTSRVPPSLVESGLAADGLVVLLEPRRVAARAAARRMSNENGSPLGDVYGYQVRFDRKASPRTRVLVVTPGVFLRRLQDDPYLTGVSCVVFDEFHERSLEADLALGQVRIIRETARPELKVVVMSATVECGRISEYFGNCPVVQSQGRSFPVELIYRPRRAAIPLAEEVGAAVRDALQRTSGDVLVFLPGLHEIRQAAEVLRDVDAVVLPLHGDLPPEQQDLALQQHDRRKVVLATNVAETSVTVEGVTAVVDTGLARQLEYEPSVGMDRLRLVPISRAAADQRAGRAGRTQPGVCIRLWDEVSHRSRSEQTVPEIQRVDLSGAVLHLLAFGETAPARFPWLDPPRRESVDESIRLLELLGFLKNGSLTALGWKAAQLPVHPRLGRLLLEGEQLGCRDRAALAAAMLSERDPFVREFEGSPAGRSAQATCSDVLDRVEAMEAFEQRNCLESPFGRLHRAAARSILEVRDQLLRLLPHRDASEAGCRDTALLRCLLAAYPDRLARRRDRGSSRAVTMTGRGVKLAPTSGVVEPELFVCVDVDTGGSEGIVRLASGVQRDWLPIDQFNTRIEISFDPETEKLIARKQIRFSDLVVEETPAHITDEDEAAKVLVNAALDRWEKVLPSLDTEAGRFRTRVRCLRDWLPELQLPDLELTDLRDWLLSLAHGRRSLAELRAAPWLDLFKQQLTYEQLRAVEEEAPDRIAVPSGSRLRVDYQEGRPPVLAVRIQELFGLSETPRIARGRVKVLLHLLAPNHRPQQVTDDLASFWKNGYPLVRKELRARYPKHSWPENPLSAEAVRGVK